ncbi:MAG TPA: D-aminoacylase [Thermoanaerobaculia bacterium]|nr:D-aminoacylase [Thermoanaerobaculia bacterium]
MRRFSHALSTALCALTFACATTHPPMHDYDLMITNGRVVDGTGAPWFRADVGIRGDRIVAIGDLSHQTAASTIDAHDHIVSPGFIDLLGQSQSSVFVDPTLEAKVRQGVTTEVTGEGESPGPSNAPNAKWPRLRDYLDALDHRGTAINFALFLGASNPREMVIGTINRQPTAAELQQMEGIVDQAMRDGAIGISTSLIYLPAMYSTTDEIIALAKVAAKYDGVYFTHMRDEGTQIDLGLDEAFRIGREAKIPVNIWHLKVGGRAVWGKMPHVVDRINAARVEGIDVAANAYPYIASATSLSTLAPDWALEGGYAEFQKRLADPGQRAKIDEALQGQVAKRGDRGIYVARIDNPALAQYQKKFIEQIAVEMNVTPDKALIRLFSETKGSPAVIFFSMNEDDVRTALKQPWVSIGSDSGSPTPEARARGVATHPRAYGTFARVLGHYSRDEHLFTLEEAVRKMTSQAADRVHLEDRGVLRPGMKADVVVFDADTIRDVATFEDPHHFSEGVLDVIVNGTPVLRDGVITKALPGRALRGKGYVKQ